MKPRDDGWFGRAVIGMGMAVPLIADVIWMRFDNCPPSKMKLPNAQDVNPSGGL